MDARQLNPFANTSPINSETINNFFLHPTAQKIKYNLYLPDEIEKTTQKNFKQAIDAIAYAERQSILTAITAIIEEQVKHLFAKNTLCNNFYEHLLQLKNQAFFTENDYLNLAKYLNNIQAELEKLLTKNKYSEAEQQGLAELIHVWLPGLHLHAGIENDRLKVQTLMHDENPTFVAHPVREAELQVRANEAHAIRLIGDIESEQALPAILAILHQLQRQFAVVKPTDETSLESISYAVKLLTEANEMLYTPVSEIPSVLGHLKKHMMSDLQLLIEKLQGLTVTQATLLNAKELFLWLEGLYTHSFSPPKNRSYTKKLKETAKEKAFRLATGSTKKEVAIFYHKAAVKLLAAIQACEDKFEVKIDQSKSENNNILEVLNNATDKQDFFITISEQLQLKISDYNLYTVLQKKFQQADYCLALKNLLQVDNFDELQKQKHELQFWQLLNEARFENSQIKIESLNNAINEYALSVDQKLRLSYLKNKCQASLKGYRSDTYFKEYLGSLSETLFRRVNDGEASEVIHLLDANDNSSQQLDPKKIILMLFEARKKLLSKKHSHTLLPCIENLLLEAYTHLLNKEPQLKQAATKKTADASTFFAHAVSMPEDPVRPEKRIQL